MELDRDSKSKGGLKFINIYIFNLIVFEGLTPT